MISLKNVQRSENLTLAVLAAIILMSLWAMTGCQSAEKQPEPMEPETIDEPTVEPEEPDETETPDEKFVREWDACWAIYTSCQDTQTKDECFPAMEKCGIAAYRKLKKARGEG